MATFASVATLASLISTYSLIILVFYVLIIVAQWKIFTKAGQEGWKALIPIYNVVVLYKIIGLSPWLLLLYLLSVVPVVGWIISIALSIVSTVKLAKAFNQSTAFIFGLLFLSPIFQMILGFGKAEYVGPENNTTNTSVQ
ncbi:MAG: hypothetical protein KHW52_02905 [Clostridium sp.]|nr:hypothetical protein [Clostridium sp.]